jgi:hypothetical protein
MLWTVCLVDVSRGGGRGLGLYGIFPHGESCSNLLLCFERKKVLEEEVRSLRSSTAWQRQEKDDRRMSFLKTKPILFAGQPLGRPRGRGVAGNIWFVLMGIAILERKIAQGTINAVVDITRLRKTGLLHAFIKGVRMRRAFLQICCGRRGGGGAGGGRGGNKKGRRF